MSLCFTTAAILLLIGALVRKLPFWGLTIPLGLIIFFQFVTYVIGFVEIVDEFLANEPGYWEIFYYGPRTFSAETQLTFLMLTNVFVIVLLFLHKILSKNMEKIGKWAKLFYLAPAIVILVYMAYNLFLSLNYGIGFAGMTLIVDGLLLASYFAIGLTLCWRDEQERLLANTWTGA